MVVVPNTVNVINIWQIARVWYKRFCDQAVNPDGFSWPGQPGQHVPLIAHPLTNLIAMFVEYRTIVGDPVFTNIAGDLFLHKLKDSSYGAVSQ